MFGLPTLQFGLIIIGVLATVFAFSAGFRDSSTIVATVVSTRVLSPTKAFLLCAIFEFVGVTAFGSAVAATVGRDFMEAAAGRTEVLMALGTGLTAAIGWGVVSWWRAWPTSNSHALFAGLVGSSYALWGLQYFQNKVAIIVLLVLVASPLIGFLVSVALTAGLRHLGQWCSVRVMPVVSTLHIVSCMLVSCAHGSNDGQLLIGLMVLAYSALPVTGELATQVDVFHIPVAFRLVVACALSAGVLLGGRRILKRLGMKLYRIRPPQGLSSQLTSAITVLSCAFAGFPASTTQVVTGSIVGAGVAKNPKIVRWHTAQEVLLSWVVTLPSVALAAYALCRFVRWSIGE